MRISRPLRLIAIILPAILWNMPTYAAKTEALAEKRCLEPANPDTTLPRIINACACVTNSLPRFEIYNQEVGEAVLEIAIDDHNNPLSVGIVKNSGTKLLDRMAVNTLSHCIYRSGVVNGKPTQGTVHLIYGWKVLRDDDDHPVPYIR